MNHRVPDEEISRYYREGYIVFRSILPESLIRDLRRECERGNAARHAKGVKGRRLQPLQNYADDIDLKPFRDYGELPELIDAIHQVLTPEHYHACLDVMGVLFEPDHLPHCMRWHRDITLASSRLPAEEYQDLMLDWNSVNQVNCPLFDDDCLWFVPGSHLRMRDLPGETEAFNAYRDLGIEANADAVVVERANNNYVKSMPGAFQLRLHAGDFALYRPCGWHTGNYSPYKKRATLHDAVFTPQYETWWRQWRAGGSPRWSKALSVAV
jgi:hypothetical protein